MAIEDKHKIRKMNKFPIKLLGEELVIVGDISEEYAKQLSSHINQIANEINKAYPRLSRQRVLGLAIINIADEYYKLKDSFYQKQQDIDLLEREHKKLREKYSKLKKEYQELLELLEGDG